MRRALIFAVPTVLAAAVLTGCGSPAPATTTAPSSSTPSPTRSPAPDPFAGKSGRQILRAARLAVDDASAVHMKGAGRDHGRRVALDLRVQFGRTATGTIDGGRGGPMQVRRVGKVVYLKASQRFWQANGMPARPAMLFGGDWIKGSANGATMRHTLPAVGRSLLDDSLRAEGKVRRVNGITIDGTPTVGLRYRNGGDIGIVYVATRGPAYPLRMATVPGARNPGRFTFNGWDRPVKVGAPRDAFDIDRLTHRAATVSCGCTTA